MVQHVSPPLKIGATGLPATVCSVYSVKNLFVHVFDLTSDYLAGYQTAGVPEQHLVCSDLRKQKSSKVPLN